VGGPAILAECRQIVAAQGRCPTGQAVITTGGKLRARFVIHAIGPVWSGGSGERGLLASAYRASLAIAAQRRITSIAFPSISTGAYGFPVERAAEIALRTVHDFVARESHAIAEARFVLFSDADLAIYETSLDRLRSSARAGARELTGSNPSTMPPTIGSSPSFLAARRSRPRAGFFGLIGEDDSHGSLSRHRRRQALQGHEGARPDRVQGLARTRQDRRSRGRQDSRKYRELIALAVAHVTQCVYRIDAHAKGAKKPERRARRSSKRPSRRGAARRGRPHGTLALKLYDRA
jgi:AhpD family alkylhydroperoxidase